MLKNGLKLNYDQDYRKFLNQFVSKMGRDFNIKRQLSQVLYKIGDCMDMVNVRLNDHLLSRESMDELKDNIQTVEILDEIKKAQYSIHIMKSTINLLKFEQKRRRVQAEVKHC